MESKIEQALRDLHDACDKLNGELGNRYTLCLFCGSAAKAQLAKCRPLIRGLEK